MIAVGRIITIGVSTIVTSICKKELISERVMLVDPEMN